MNQEIGTHYTSSSILLEFIVLSFAWVEGLVKPLEVFILQEWYSLSQAGVLLFSENS